MRSRLSLVTNRQMNNFPFTIHWNYLPVDKIPYYQFHRIQYRQTDSPAKIDPCLFNSGLNLYFWNMKRDYSNTFWSPAFSLFEWERWKKSEKSRDRKRKRDRRDRLRKKWKKRRKKEKWSKTKLGSPGMWEGGEGGEWLYRYGSCSFRAALGGPLCWHKYRLCLASRRCFGNPSRALCHWKVVCTKHWEKTLVCVPYWNTWATCHCWA